MTLRALFFLTLLLFPILEIHAQTTGERPRILVSTDIGGTDADDNQSMIHLLMTNDRFDIEGLVSSPSFGDGKKEEILRMIDLYASDYPLLAAHCPQLLSPDSLKTLCKQGRKGLAPFCGYDQPTEGSQHIILCARKNSDRPLWILVWGTLEDVAQALHDAPDIADKIRIYWIGGPNKKWGVNSYSYIVRNFPHLWFIENNASYRGFISNNKDTGEWESGYYETHIRGRGVMGEDFIAYYGGNVKMGDTPSLLYMMHGDPDDPTEESWGGRFEPMTHSPYRIYDRITTRKDTVPVYGVWELRLPLPTHLTKSERPLTPFILDIDRQRWAASYSDSGYAVVRYAAKVPATLHYLIHSDIPSLQGLQGSITISTRWPGEEIRESDIRVGKRWFTDVQSDDLFQGQWQGAKTTSRWRIEVLKDWAIRWDWLIKNPQK